MIDNLHIIAAVPQDLSFAWETEIFLDNIEKIYNNTIKTTIIIGTHKGTERYQEYWDLLSQRYNQVEFKFYSIDHLKKIISVYPPIMRPYVLKCYWKDNPQVSKECIFYCDTDIIFTKPFNFEKYLADDINYLSKTNYISASYFYNKIKDSFPFKRKEYEERDIFGGACRLVGLLPSTVEENEENTGGCQYILKNIDYQFWEDVEKDCVHLRMYFQEINREFFSSEESGFQSWAIGDMCGVLWNLWKRGYKTICPEEMNFSWATSPIENWTKNAIYHNAGVTGLYLDKEEKRKAFNKSDLIFRTSLKTPFDIDEWKDLDTEHCGYNYVQLIKQFKNPICTTKNKKLVY